MFDGFPMFFFCETTIFPSFSYADIFEVNRATNGSSDFPKNTSSSGPPSRFRKMCTAAGPA